MWEPLGAEPVTEGPKLPLRRLVPSTRSRQEGQCEPQPRELTPLIRDPARRDRWFPSTPLRTGRSTRPDIFRCGCLFPASLPARFSLPLTPPPFPCHPPPVPSPHRTPALSASPARATIVPMFCSPALFKTALAAARPSRPPRAANRPLAALSFWLIKLIHRPRKLAQSDEKSVHSTRCLTSIRKN
jgi:hypothetical protein